MNDGHGVALVGKVDNDPEYPSRPEVVTRASVQLEAGNPVHSPVGHIQRPSILVDAQGSTPDGIDAPPPLVVEVAHGIRRFDKNFFYPPRPSKGVERQGDLRVFFSVPRPLEKLPHNVVKNPAIDGDEPSPRGRRDAHGCRGLFAVREADLDHNNRIRPEAFSGGACEDLIIDDAVDLLMHGLVGWADAAIIPVDPKRPARAHQCRIPSSPIIRHAELVGRMNGDRRDNPGLANQVQRQ